jgi:FkbM family methyltransferase
VNIRTGLVQSVRTQARKRLSIDVRRWPPRNTIEHALTSVFAARSVEAVVDVGANDGGFGRLLRSIGFEGRILSFEPAPAAFGRLLPQLDASWTAHQVALGEATGVATLRTFRRDSLSSLHQPSEWSRQNWPALAEEETSFEVPVRRLDDCLAEASVAAPVYLKIDTQGHDRAVLDGAPLTLERALGVQVEISMYNLYEGGGTSLTDWLELLDGSFDLVGLFPIQYDRKERLVPVEFDGVFVRSELPNG